MECTRFAGWTSSLTAEEIRQVLATRASAPTYKDTGSQYKPTAKKAKSTAFPQKLEQEDKPRVLKTFGKKTRAEQAAARARAATGREMGDEHAGGESNRRTITSALKRAAAHARIPQKMEVAFACLDQLKTVEERLEYMEAAAED